MTMEHNMFNTNFVFKPGKLTSILDCSSGSSGKSKIGSFICEYANNWQFACCTFAPNAGHTVVLDDGSTYFYQTFNSCAYKPDRYEKLYIAPGAIIELPAFWRELEINKIPHHKIGISPLASILQNIDGDFEKGLCDFDGNYKQQEIGGYLAKTGTTAHGCGANRARRVLRRPEAKYAKDIPNLKRFICDVPGEIMTRLDAGQSGLLEIAQGFQLSYLLPEFAPFTTSRNCTVAAALDDLMVPPIYAGNVILNTRTFPIRINNNKYVENSTGRHLTWAEMQQMASNDYTVVKGNSGPWYSDQEEITWDQLTKDSGSPESIIEMTSVTKLPRRIATYSQQNISHAIKHNRTGHEIFLSLNFANYVDYEITGKRAVCTENHIKNISPKLDKWLRHNNVLSNNLRFIGTGAKTNDKILIEHL